MAVSSPMPASLRHRMAEHAASGALRDLLEHHRLSYGPEPLSEGAIFGLSGALDLRVRVAPTAVPVIDVEGRAPTLELELCEHVGIAARWCTAVDPATGWEALRAELDAGRPAIVRADRALLDYRGGDSHDTRHAILVTGHEPDADAVWVLDGGFPEPQRCATRALAAARASQGWPEPSHHGLLQVTKAPTRLADPRVAIRAALERVVHAMRHPPRPEHPHMRVGLAAADALAAAWPQLPASAGPRLGTTLAALRSRIRDAGTGGALYRSLQARFLHDAAALLGSPQLGRAALCCDDLADAWRELAEALDHPDGETAHRVGEPWLQRVRKLEYEHVAALEEHLRVDQVSARRRYAPSRWATTVPVRRSG